MHACTSARHACVHNSTHHASMHISTPRMHAHQYTMHACTSVHHACMHISTPYMHISTPRMHAHQYTTHACTSVHQQACTSTLVGGMLFGVCGLLIFLHLDFNTGTMWLVTATIIPPIMAIKARAALHDSRRSKQGLHCIIKGDQSKGCTA